MKKIYVLSNDTKSINELFDFIYKTEGLKIVGCSNDLVRAALSIYTLNKPDIILFGKQISDECAKNLNDLLEPAFKVIFISLNEQSKEFYKRHNIHYINAPFNYDEFLQIVYAPKKEVNPLKRQIISSFGKENHFFIKCEKGKIIRIDIPDILFIEANQNYITINQIEEQHITNFTLNGIEKVLPENNFIRIHRSFIVNINKIRSIESNRLMLEKNISIPIGLSYKEAVSKIFNSKIIVLNKMARFTIWFVAIFNPLCELNFLI